MPAHRLIAMLGFALGGFLFNAGALGSEADAWLVDENLHTPGAESFSSELAEYSAWEDAVASVSSDAVGALETVEPVSVPEPSGFAMLAGLAALLLAMTILRWHFDRTNEAAATVTEKHS